MLGKDGLVEQEALESGRPALVVAPTFVARVLAQRQFRDALAAGIPLGEVVHRLSTQSFPLQGELTRFGLFGDPGQVLDWRPGYPGSVAVRPSSDRGARSASSSGAAADSCGATPGASSGAAPGCCSSG